ncbi:SLC2A13 [Mytilus coruscus]|uniref:SLC2A13 n=1 Tax=Mytilus coruscus TaxID=42192 RepID=A0A6J8EJY9_MYTCO|nr:SLC2A13 [Mytilus coruscus]
MSGFPSKLAIWLVCVPFAVNFLATFIGIYLVERAGRRILTLGSFVGIIIALIVLAVGFQLSVIHTPPVALNETHGLPSKCEYSKCDPCIRNKDCGFCYVKDNATASGSCLPVYSDHPERYADPNFSNFSKNFRCNKENYEHDMKDFTWANNYCPTEYSWMAVLGLALFVIGFAPVFGINLTRLHAFLKSTHNSKQTLNKMSSTRRDLSIQFSTKYFRGTSYDDVLGEIKKILSLDDVKSIQFTETNCKVCLQDFESKGNRLTSGSTLKNRSVSLYDVEKNITNVTVKDLPLRTR